jgi:hypothetical protein
MMRMALLFLCVHNDPSAICRRVSAFLVQDTHKRPDTEATT